MFSGLVLLSAVIIATGLPGNWLQAVRVARKQTSTGLSSAYFMVGLVSAMAWATYGYMLHHGTQVFTSGSALLANVVVAVVMWRLRSLSYVSIAIVLSCLIAVVVSGMAGGSQALGLVAGTLDVGGRLPQAWAALRRPGGVGVSTANFVVNATNGGAWVAYGVVHGDVLIAASSVYCVAVNVFVVWRTYNARRLTESNCRVPALGSA